MKFTLSVLQRAAESRNTVREIGHYATLDEAIAAAKGVVNDVLRRVYVAGMTPDQLFESYRAAAETPYLARDDEETMNANSFNHFQFAKLRSSEICAASK